MAKQEAAIESVNLTDGRVADFVGKRKLIKEAVTFEDGSVGVRLDFRNGQTRTFAIPDGLIDKLAQHGASQKLGDEVAGMEDPDDMVLAIDKLIERLSKGEWTAERSGAGMAGTSMLAKALAEFKGKPLEVIQAWLADKDDKAKSGLRAIPEVKAIIERLQAERAANAKPKDHSAAAALLGSLDDLG